MIEVATRPHGRTSDVQNDNVFSNVLYVLFCELQGLILKMILVLLFTRERQKELDASAFNISHFIHYIYGHCIGRFGLVSTLIFLWPSDLMEP